ncbi:MAG: response regulator transcription factor [Saprospirales bacterium]|nr:response regulator transcription factor [Saprospirales bacterium]MBK8923281.1 response regulator transcription factor [Saprospirales bacterium]
MKVLIIEDENAAARRLEKLLKDVAPDIVVLQQLDSVESSVLWLGQHPAPDLIFLDIHLADGASFDIFEHIQVQCPVIFTTAYNEYALQAFKVNAVDYLLKPIKSNELGAALEKYNKVFKPATKAPDYAALLETLKRHNEPQFLQRLLIRFGHSLRLVDMADAAYFYTKDKITFLITRSDGKRYPVDYPLDKLETLLNPKAFFRINRQFIVQVGAIKEMHPYSKSRVKVELQPPTDLETIVSTERSAEFKKWLVGEIAG